MVDRTQKLTVREEEKMREIAGKMGVHEATFEDLNAAVRLPDWKLKPGHYRIIWALQKGERRFTDLKNEASFARDATTLSQYLKQLTDKHIIEKNPETSGYHFPKVLQPLAPKSFPITGWALEVIIGTINAIANDIAGLKDPEERRKALADYLRENFSFMASCLITYIDEACHIEKREVANEFIQRSLETYFIPWIRMLSLVCFRHKEEFMKSTGEISDVFVKTAEASSIDFHRHLTSKTLKEYTEKTDQQKGVDLAANWHLVVNFASKLFVTLTYGGNWQEALTDFREAFRFLWFKTKDTCQVDSLEALLYKPKLTGREARKLLRLVEKKYSTLFYQKHIKSELIAGDGSVKPSLKARTRSPFR